MELKEAKSEMTFLMVLPPSNMANIASEVGTSSPDYGLGLQLKCRRRSVGREGGDAPPGAAGGEPEMTFRVVRVRAMREQLETLWVLAPSDYGLECLEIRT